MGFPMENFWCRKYSTENMAKMFIQGSPEWSTIRACREGEMKRRDHEFLDAGTARLEFENVMVAYNGHPILDDLSFEVPHGAQVAVVGPNGAGKSTLFKALVGLLPLRKGQIRIHGLPLGQHKDCVAYIPQREEVDWRFPVTVEEVVMMGRFNDFGWLGKPGEEDHAAVQQSMNQLGITKLAETFYR